MVSLYEVSDVVPDTSFRARDLVRGGEPVLISERSATRTLKQWDRFAGRVVQVGQQTQISGAVLSFEYETSENLIKGLRSIGKLTRKEKKELAKAIGEDFDPAIIANLSETERLRAVSSTFTTCWLVDAMIGPNSRKCPICATPTAMSFFNARLAIRSPTARRTTTSARHWIHAPISGRQPRRDGTGSVGRNAPQHRSPEPDRRNP